MDADAILQAALAQHQAGNLDDAARGYQELLKRNPDNVDATYLLGCLAHQTGNQPAAIGLLRRAIVLRPDEAQFHNALSLALFSSGEPVAARASIEKAIEIDPQPQFWNTLGTLLKRLGELAAAVDAFRCALEQDASFNEAQYNLGNAYRDLGNLAAGLTCFAAVVARDPKHFHSLAALGQCLLQAQRPTEARGYFERALAISPDDLSLRCDLADAEDACGDHDSAFALYEACVAHPIIARQRSAAHAPLARAWYGMACVRNAQREFAEARLYFAAAVSLQPEWREARHNLARALFEMGHVSEAVRQFRLCGETSESAVSRAMLAVIIPGDAAATNLEVLNARKQWSQTTANGVSKSMESRRSVKHQGSRLRIGYVSAFFHRDPWMKPVWGLINSNDRNRFAIQLFADCALSECALSECASSEERGGYRPQADDAFHDTSGLENADLFELMRNAHLDVLIDLNDYSNMRRVPLFFARPAPVVVGWFNYYAASGLPALDYLIGDDQVIPPSEEQFYTERILRVQGSYLTFQVHYPVAEVEPRPSQDAFVFGCLGSQYKVTPEVIATWSRILHEAPKSLLLMKNKALGAASTRAELSRSFAKHGIAPERLELEGPASHFDFLRAYARVDLGLDTFPYNGGTTTTEALWQGVPVVAFSGDRWVARTSASLLRAAGLEQFVAADVDAYVRLAVRYATDGELREALRALRPGMRKVLAESPVCDVKGFTRQMEKLLWSVSSPPPA